MHDPLTLIFRCGPFELWHKDPERDGSDDSCDWFGSSRPLNARERAVRDAIWPLEQLFGNYPHFDRQRTDLACHEYPSLPGCWCSEGALRFFELQRAVTKWRRRGCRIHPRWHIHHWRLRITPIARLWYKLTERCSKCGKRFAWSDWKREGAIHHFWESSIHAGCGGTTTKEPTNAP